MIYQKFVPAEILNPFVECYIRNKIDRIGISWDHEDFQRQLGAI